MIGLPYLIFKNAKSTDLGVYITKKTSYNSASRDVTFKSVPGRNGDLIIDNGRFENLVVTYDVKLIDNKYFDFSKIVRDIKNWLLAECGYFKLSDSYDPNYYRLASYNDGLNIEQNFITLGSSKFNFNCKPFKYSFEGDRIITFYEPGILYNAEIFESKPHLKIFANGDVTLSVNNESFNFTAIDEYIEVDSETMNAYKGIESQNSKMTSLEFPKFLPGENNISWVGNVKKLEIVPRWCTL